MCKDCIVFWGGDFLWRGDLTLRGDLDIKMINTFLFLYILYMCVFTLPSSQLVASRTNCGLVQHDMREHRQAAEKTIIRASVNAGQMAGQT